MSHPKEEARVEAEVEEVEAGVEEEGATQGSGFQGGWQRTVYLQGETGNREGSTRGREQKYDKSPNVKKARVNTKTPNMDKDRVSSNAMNLDTGQRIVLKTRMELSRRHFPGAQYNYMYPMVPQVPMAPVAMPSNGIQAPYARTQHCSPRPDD